MKETLLAILTLTPAIAWFINAFIKLFRLYRKHEVKIKEVTKEGAEKVKEEAGKIKGKVEEKVHKEKPDESKDESKSRAEGGSKSD